MRKVGWLNRRPWTYRSVQWSAFFWTAFRGVEASAGYGAPLRQRCYLKERFANGYKWEVYRQMTENGFKQQEEQCGSTWSQICPIFPIYDYVRNKLSWVSVSVKNRPVLSWSSNPRRDFWVSRVPRQIMRWRRFAGPGTDVQTFHTLTFNGKVSFHMPYVTNNNGKHFERRKATDTCV